MSSETREMLVFQLDSELVTIATKAARQENLNDVGEFVAKCAKETILLHGQMPAYFTGRRLEKNPQNSCQLLTPCRKSVRHPAHGKSEKRK